MTKNVLMEEHMKKILIFTSIVMMTIMVIPFGVFAEENEHNNTASCPINDNIDTSDIINMEIIYGELYIDVLTEFGDEPTVVTNFGKCKSEYKYITKNITRSELIKMKNDLKTQQNLSATTIGLLVGLTNPIAGYIAGFFAGQTRNKILATVEDTLDKSTKSNFTITSKYKCVETNMGTKGIVHRFKLVSVEIR